MASLKQDSKKQKLFLVLLVIIAIGFLSAAIIMELFKEDLSPKDSSAIYGGRIENDMHPYAGYLISYGENKTKPSICGVTYLSPTLGVSAAHCFDNKTMAYLGYSLFEFNLDNSFLAEDVIIKPGWDGKTIESDLAVIKLPRDYYEVQDYAGISSPEKGCNYEVLGYGRTEDDDERGKLEKLRKTATFCIEKIEDETIILKGKDGGVCFGDSGSPLFEKGTNNLVGILSSIITSPQSDPNNPCSVGNKAVALRADKNIGFVNSVETFSFDRDNVSICGEACTYKKCAFGLVCGSDDTCSSIKGECSAKRDEFCSIAVGLECDSGNVCSLNRCEGESNIEDFSSVLTRDIGFTIDSSDSESVAQYESLKNYLFLGAGVTFILGMLFAIIGKLKS